MKYVDEFRDPDKARSLITEIRALIPRIPRPSARPLQIMEVCGGHTHAIFRYGIQQMLPEEVEFVHGPGCPVCVLPMGRVDDCVAIAERRAMCAEEELVRGVPGKFKQSLEYRPDAREDWQGPNVFLPVWRLHLNPHAVVM